MKVLIDIGHPAHVHLFKHFASKMIKDGHIIHFTVREKEFEVELLKKEGFEYTNFGKHYKSLSGKFWGLIKCTILMVILGFKFKPDLFISHGSICSAWASFFLRVPNIALEDTGNNEQVNLYLPFTEVILTSNVFHKDYGTKQIKYAGFHELAYLHPDYFKPDIDIRNKIGLGTDQNLFIIRFVSWNATHDRQQNGFTLNEKLDLVKMLSERGKVLVSSEGLLPEAIEQYRYNLGPNEMHNCLAIATLFIGEGATMASECAMLGTPAIYLNSMEAGTISNQENYGLIYHFKDGSCVNRKVLEVLMDTNVRRNCNTAREKMLSEKIDVTAFIVWLVENYPTSINILKTNPDYQKRFMSAQNHKE